MVWLLAALVVGFALVLIVRGFLAADPRALARSLRRLAIGLALLVVAALLVTERLGLIVALAGAAAPLLVRLRPLFGGHGPAAAPGAGPAASGPGPSGGRSTVRTRCLVMELDHASGAMTGRVIDAGAAAELAGRSLDSLSLAELLQLHDIVVRVDAEGVAVLVAYLDRVHAGWRQARDGGTRSGASAAGADGFAAVMSRAEALNILGLEPEATPEAIRRAHRQLMLKMHPDQGGSTYLAAKINQAKDLLLGS